MKKLKQLLFVAVCCLLAHESTAQTPVPKDELVLQVEQTNEKNYEAHSSYLSTLAGVQQVGYCKDKHLFLLKVNGALNDSEQIQRGFTSNFPGCRAEIKLGASHAAVISACNFISPSIHESK